MSTIDDETVTMTMKERNIPIEWYIESKKRKEGPKKKRKEKMKPLLGYSTTALLLASAMPRLACHAWMSSRP